MRSSSLYLLLAFGSLILFAGCEDTPESTVPTLELNGDAGPRLAVRDAAATNVPVIDATAIQPDPPRGDAPGAGGGDDLDCQPGETRCDDAGERERCDLMGLWQKTPCAETGTRASGGGGQAHIAEIAEVRDVLSHLFVPSRNAQEITAKMGQQLENKAPQQATLV